MIRIVTGSVLVAMATLLPAQEAPTKAEQKGLGPDAKAAVIDVGPAPGGNPRPGNRQEAGGNRWFPLTEKDLGTFFGAEHATGVFTFTNPTDDEVVWRGLQGSCTCAKAVIRIGDRTYELTSKPKPNQLFRIFRNADGSEQREQVQQLAIAPREAGEVEVHLEVPNVPGPRQAHLDVHTTDKQLPQFKLKWSALSAQLFTVSPAEVNLNKMAWNDKREFTVTVTSPLHPEFEILGMDGGDEAFDVKWEKRLAGGVQSYVIQGTYGPVGADTGGGGLLKFRTDVRGGASFQVRVMAIVEGPLEVKPGAFLPLGMVRRGNEVKKEVVFEPNDGIKLTATGLTFEKLTVPEEFLAVTARNDGNKLIVEVTIKPDTPSGLLKGDLVVDLNHPLVKQKRIMFNGFVR